MYSWFNMSINLLQWWIMKHILPTNAISYINVENRRVILYVCKEGYKKHIGVSSFFFLALLKITYEVFCRQFNI